MEKIYRIYSMANGVLYRNIHYNNVPINWFVVDRLVPAIPFFQAIKNYNHLNPTQKKDTEAFINEHFTSQEASQLKNFLIQLKNRVTIEEIDLPIDPDSKSFHSINIGDGMGFFVLHKKKEYQLPFKVEGLFNVNLGDEVISPDEKVTVISRIDPKMAEKLKKMSEGSEKDEVKGDKTRLFIEDDKDVD